jgi:exodeoxyribonuclease VII small subunit
MTKASAKDLSKLSFEEAMAELEKIIKSLEGGTTTLESSITAYEDGMRLKEFCAQKLKDAEMKIETITQNSKGELERAPFSSSSSTTL